jgi:uncharacterized membrane protein
MWALYRRRFITTQSFILGVCLVMRFYFGKTWLLVGICFVVMQVFSIVGAAWGDTLAKRIEQSKDELPLNRK